MPIHDASSAPMQGFVLMSGERQVPQLAVRRCYNWVINEVTVVKGVVFGDILDELLCFVVVVAV